MAEKKEILIFPETKESKKIFDSFISQGDSYIQFGEKNEEGLKKLSSQNFDLIIVEINKPLISEISFIESIHSLENNLPIVIVSEYFRDTKDVLFADTAYNYIPKPLTMDKLSETVQKALEETRILKETHEEQVKIKSVFENKKLSILYEISKKIHSLNDLDKLLKTLIDYAKDIIGAERATVFMIDKSTNELWSRIGTGINKREIRFSKTKGIAGKVVATGKYILTSDPYSHPDFNQEFDQKSGFKTRSLLCVPMFNIQGRITGAFQVINKLEGDFTEEDIEFLEALSSNASISIENSTLQEEKMKKIEEMHLLFDELKNSQKELIIKTRSSTVEKIIKIFQEAKNSRAMSLALTKGKSLVAGNKEAENQIDKIGEVHNKILEIIEDYLNKMIIK